MIALALTLARVASSMRAWATVTSNGTIVNRASRIVDHDRGRGRRKKFVPHGHERFYHWQPQWRRGARCTPKITLDRDEIRVPSSLALPSVTPSPKFSIPSQTWVLLSTSVFHLKTGRLPTLTCRPSCGKNVVPTKVRVFFWPSLQLPCEFS